MAYKKNKSRISRRKRSIRTKSRSRSRSRSMSRSNPRGKKNRRTRYRIKGGCEECVGSSPSDAPVWSGGELSKDIFNYEVNPIFYSSS